MYGDIVTLRDFINYNELNQDEIKIKTFCELMKKVSEKVEQEERNLIKINIDEININIKTGEIILPENLFSKADDMEKTMAGFSTGISMMADRKSTKEHKRISFALMVLGWYCNPNRGSISNDMDVLENFDYYMDKVPNWLKDFFINVFRKMNYDIPFDKYYNDNFTDKIKSEIKNSLEEYKLNNEQLEKIYNVILKKAIRLGDKSE